MNRNNGIVVGWKTVEKKELVRHYKPRWWGWGGLNDDGVMYAASAESAGVGAVGILPPLTGSGYRTLLFRTFAERAVHNG